jgi:cytoskeleton protein RodZ
VGVLVVVLGAASTLLLGRAREPAAVPARSPARGPATAESRPPAPAQPATSAAPAAPAQAATAESAAPRAAAASATTPPSAPAGPAMSPDAAPPRAPGPGPAEAAAAAPAAERVLVMRAVDTTWVRVTPDGGPPSEETLAPGAVRQWKSARAFRVTIGNAGGVQLELDGRALPALGGRGQVVHTTIPDERRP